MNNGTRAGAHEGFSKTFLHLHEVAGKAVCKGVCGVSAPFGAFTYPSPILHTDGHLAKIARNCPILSLFGWCVKVR